jgi:hypothetical protein
MMAFPRFHLGSEHLIMEQDLSRLENESFYENDYVELPPSDIVAYNELRSCADLFRMKQQGILEITPEFQRDIVWKGPDQTRFIDSLIKQLPIPSMCFALDHKAQRWIVIDGLQRISTIIRFLDGGDWTLSPLEDVDAGIAGKSAAAIKTSRGELHQYYTRVENLSVPVTVLRCDFKKKSHMEYLFTIFHRLNTGGMKLNNQEIRNCIYGGAFNILLKELDQFLPWRRLNKMRPNQSYRFTKQEIILRFLAFHDRMSTYEGHLAKFLNTYMYDNRDASPHFLQQKNDLFKRTVICISDQIFAGNAPGKLSVTVLEALLIGVSKNIKDLADASGDVLRARYDELINHDEFSDTALREGLSKKPRVASRLAAAIAVFAGK